MNWHNLRMHYIRRLPLLILLLTVFGAAAWLLLPRQTPLSLMPVESTTVDNGDPQQAIQPLQVPPGLIPARVSLGERLFHDARLSVDFSLACASCHPLDRGGADGRRVSLGVGGALGGINAPTVLNSGYNMVQFWDGRAATLEEQAAGPIHNPLEMGSNWTQVLARLAQDEALRTEFLQVYPDGLNAANVANALASFERSLVTPNSRFDRFLKGDERALSEIEQEGYRQFSRYGCTSCHQGSLLGGNMYQKFGVLGDYFAGRPLTRDDFGRFNVTGREEDKHVFKVPSLRNVARTAPYFHDGSAETLEQAVVVMGRYQLGRDLSEADINAIVAFLKTLDGDLPRASGT